MTSGPAPRAAEGGPSWEPPPARGDSHERRRRAGRRALLATLLVVPALALVSFLESLPALFLALVLGQVAAVVVARRRRGRPRAADAGVHVGPTAAARAWFPAAWALMLVAIFLGTAPVRLGLCLLLACSATAWPLARRNAERVRLRRIVPPRGRAGAPTVVEYVLENPTSRTGWRYVVRDALGLHARPGTIEALFDSVDAGGEARATATVSFDRRGLRRLRPAEVTTRAPLGLFEARFSEEAAAEILVRPAEGRPTAELIARLTGAAVQTSSTVTVRAGTDELHGLRAFREGDDPRRIHWRTTARRGERTFVERRDDAARRALVVLGRGAGPALAADRAFERAVSVAATVLRAATRAGLPTRLVLGGPGDAPAAARGPRSLARALDALALVKGAGDRRPHAALARAAVADGTTVVWVDAGGDGGPPPPRAGCDLLVLRADAPDLARWVRGIP